MDGLELVSFKIISAVGMAKSSFIEAMNLMQLEQKSRKVKNLLTVDT